jgi:hypothetical protein
MSELNELTHSPEQVEAAIEAKKKAEIQRHNELQDLRAVLSTKEGRRLAWRILTWGGIFNYGYDGSGSHVYYEKGARDLTLKFLDEIMTANPELYFLMTRENSEEKGESK